MSDAVCVVDFEEMRRHKQAKLKALYDEQEAGRNKGYRWKILQKILDGRLPRHIRQPKEPRKYRRFLPTIIGLKRGGFVSCSPQFAEGWDTLGVR